jgi:cation diffusion facilitator family transporter
MRKAPTDPLVRAREVRRVLVQVLVLNLAVAAFKVAAFLSSNALSVLAEVMHTSLDATNNMLALAIARVAARAPDEDHPYGHQKFETLGALLLAGVLSVTVFELGHAALSRILAPVPPPVSATPLAVGIMVASVAVNLVVTGYESRQGRALGSDLLLADAAHTRSDVFATIGVLAGLGLVALGAPAIDAWISLAVAAVIAHTGWRIIRRTVPVLVDERAVDPVHIQRVAEHHKAVFSCYRIRSRGRRGEVFAELTIALDPKLDVAHSHAIADEVERSVSRAVGAREVLVHVEPAD